MRSTAAKLTLETLVPRDVMSALAAMGIYADERGDEAVALCPNPDHLDRSPSWSCNLDTGLHNCFSCQFGGSFTYLVTKMLGIPTPDASTWVRARKLKDVAAGFVGPRPKVERKAIELSEADLWKFIDPPEDALASRGLTAEACRAYDVRWDAEHDYWITTVRDPWTGKLWGWQEKNARHFNNYPRNLVKSETLFGHHRLPPGGVALLVESPLDVPYVFGHLGDRVFPVSSYGAAVSDLQVAIVRERASMVILAMDNDRAGWKAVSKLAFAFGTTPVSVFNYRPGRDRDWIIGEDSLDARDPGNLDIDELSYGIEHAIPKWRLRIPWL